MWSVVICVKIKKLRKNVWYVVSGSQSAKLIGYTHVKATLNNINKIRGKINYPKKTV